jgi:hypothetical protein
LNLDGFTGAQDVPFSFGKPAVDPDMGFLLDALEDGKAAMETAMEVSVFSHMRSFKLAAAQLASDKIGGYDDANAYLIVQRLRGGGDVLVLQVAEGESIAEQRWPSGVDPEQPSWRTYTAIIEVSEGAAAGKAERAVIKHLKTGTDFSAITVDDGAGNMVALTPANVTDAGSKLRELLDSLFGADQIGSDYFRSLALNPDSTQLARLSLQDRLDRARETARRAVTERDEARTALENLAEIVFKEGGDSGTSYTLAELQLMTRIATVADLQGAYQASFVEAAKRVDSSLGSTSFPLLIDNAAEWNSMFAGSGSSAVVAAAEAVAALVTGIFADKQALDNAARSLATENTFSVAAPLKEQQVSALVLDMLRLEDQDPVIPAVKENVLDAFATKIQDLLNAGVDTKAFIHTAGEQVTKITAETLGGLVASSGGSLPANFGTFMQALGTSLSTVLEGVAGASLEPTITSIIQTFINLGDDITDIKSKLDTLQTKNTTIDITPFTAGLAEISVLIGNLLSVEMPDLSTTVSDLVEEVVTLKVEVENAADRSAAAISAASENPTRQTILTAIQRIEGNLGSGGGGASLDVASLLPLVKHLVPVYGPFIVYNIDGNNTDTGPWEALTRAEMDAVLVADYNNAFARDSGTQPYMELYQALMRPDLGGADMGGRWYIWITKPGDTVEPPELGMKNSEAGGRLHEATTDIVAALNRMHRGAQPFVGVQPDSPEDVLFQAFAEALLVTISPSPKQAITSQTDQDDRPPGAPTWNLATPYDPQERDNADGISEGILRIRGTFRYPFSEAVFLPRWVGATDSVQTWGGAPIFWRRKTAARDPIPHPNVGYVHCCEYPRIEISSGTILNGSLYFLIERRGRVLNTIRLSLTNSDFLHVFPRDTNEGERDSGPGQ